MNTSSWNVWPEIVSALVICVLIFNRANIQVRVTPRNRMFYVLLLFTFFCLLLNIFKVVSISYKQLFPFWIIFFTHTLYFAIYPLIVLLVLSYMFLYFLELVPQKEKRHLLFGWRAIGGIAILHPLFALANITTGWIFSFDETGQYIQGPLHNISLYLAMIEVCVFVLIIWRDRKYLERLVFHPVFWIPPLVIGILLFQSFRRDIILTGSAMMAAVLGIYLNFQMIKIETDSLTNLPNREAFVAELYHYIQQKRKKLVIIASLDDFKIINATFGQRAGDIFLTTITRELKRICSAGQWHRYSGDEFAIISEPELAEMLISSLEKRFEEPWKAEGRQAVMSACFAILQIPCKFDPISLLDHAIRTAKKQGKHQTIWCDDTFISMVERQNTITTTLRERPMGANLFLVYQPIVRLEDESIVMAEALMRMHDKQLGEISPSEFIPLAEELGIIGDLDSWVLNQVCSMLNELQHKDFLIPPICVNFSAQQFSDPTIADEILDIIKQYHVLPHRICLELTESIFIGKKLDQVESIMKPLINNGIRFHLDDFGTGYSNLASLISLPFSAIKIDKSLIWQMKNKHYLIMIKNIVETSLAIGRQVVAEGIETHEQLDMLRDIGCPYAQGLYFAKPMKIDQFIAYVEKGNSPSC